MNNESLSAFWREASIPGSVHSVLRESLGLATSVFTAKGRMDNLLKDHIRSPFADRYGILTARLHQRALHCLTERQEIALAR